MKQILLISPDFNPEEKRLEAAMSTSNRTPSAYRPFMDTRGFMVPLHMAAIAALTPDDVEVNMWDEAVRGQITARTDFKQDYDLVGVTGYATHIGRMKELGQIFRQRGIPIAIGGPGVAAAPEHYRGHFDILFIGEAENIWPQFIAD
jgi:B12 binding domain